MGVDHEPADGPPTSPLQNAALQAGFAQLQARFLAGLPQRWSDIVQAPPGPLRDAALHRLAGAAGSYGLTALGEAARRAERSDAPEAALAAVLAQIKAAGVTV